MVKDGGLYIVKNTIEPYNKLVSVLRVVITGDDHQRLYFTWKRFTGAGVAPLRASTLLTQTHTIQQIRAVQYGLPFDNKVNDTIY